ncbi:LAGLIDADG family homing endonuclease [Paenibacillus xylaniclasticus]|uniref:LAGLIDADG family homing endonuclease n=1 Tax=Paenibacillus xylaniclasticus TaxID=588083 RepID=UPI0013DF2B7E|nr:LAGLIDADG family homing endonuclease [Paenibacillus xylaniclasticus]
MDIVVKSSQAQLSQRKLEGYLKLAQIIQWGRRSPVKFCERFFGIEFLDAQKYAFMNTWLKPYNLWCITRNGGKALALDTPIPTPTGYKLMKDIVVGDSVFSADGSITNVIATSDIFLNHDCYEVEFEDGEKVIADADHLWYVQTSHTRRLIKENKDIRTRSSKSVHINHNYDNIDKDGFVVLRTIDMASDFVHARKDGRGLEFKYRVPITKPIQFSEKQLPIHPYLLGVWLVDGDSNDIRITSHLNDYKELCNHLNVIGYSTKIYNRNNNVVSIDININDKKVQPNETKDIFRSLNLLGNKHIPEIYLQSSVEQRFELLRGLMDTYGSYNKSNKKCEFSQKSKVLIDQFSKLLTSLGIKHNIQNRVTTCNGEKFNLYRVEFYTDKLRSCFRLSRKHNLLPDSLNKRSNNKSIVSIKEISSVPTKCIMVDNSKGLFLFGEKYTVTHNSTLSAPFIMTKGILFAGHNTYILSNVSAQSQDTFMKIEKIAKKEINSFTGLTDFFMGELVKSAANTDGFTHAQSGFNYKLYNGSSVTSLSGDINNNRGKRSALNIYDESGWTEEEYVVATTPFLLQNATFRMGGDIDVSTFPKQVPNQRLFISSASSTDSYFYTLYRDYAKRMMLGDKDYFVCDINCEVMINPLFNGKIYPVSLIERNEIDAEMRKNKEKALREFYNKFSIDGGDNQVFKRAVVVRNSVTRLPVIKNDNTRKRRFVLAYDPAHHYDNSVCFVGEIIEDPRVGFRMEICNGVSFVDVGKKKKTPMRTPEQMAAIKQMLLDYNGIAPDYENIECLMIDSGSGGHGTTYSDYLMEDWVDADGNLHKGLIDKIENQEYVSRFPNAVDKLKLMSPQKYKKEMYDALLEMLNLDLISFTAEYDSKGFLMLPRETGKDLEVVNDEGKIVSEKEIIYSHVKLDFEEELALKNIDLAKEELVNIYRHKGTNDNYRYDLSTDKAGKMNDDRAYCLAMLGWYLQQVRRQNIVNRVHEEIDISSIPSQVSTLNIRL